MFSTDDLVRRLETPWTYMGKEANHERLEAANEIKRLQYIVKEHKENLDIFRSLVKFLCSEGENNK
jgi:hypothetical protein